MKEEGRMIRISNYLQNKKEYIIVFLTIVKGSHHNIEDLYKNVNNLKYEKFENIQKLGTIYPGQSIDVPYSKLIMNRFPNYMTVIQFHVRTVPISTQCKKSFNFPNSFSKIYLTSTRSSSSSSKSNNSKYNYYSHSLIEDEFKGCKEITIFGHDGVIVAHSTLGSLYLQKPPLKLIHYLKKKVQELSPDYRTINNFLKKLQHKDSFRSKTKLE
ncbi:hypothetical protein CsatB_006239 [Cannabis sativa]